MRPMRLTKLACLACACCLILSWLQWTKLTQQQPTATRRIIVMQQASAMENALHSRAVDLKTKRVTAHVPSLTSSGQTPSTVSNGGTHNASITSTPVMTMPPPHKVAVFTIVRNENFFLPIWLRYYRQHFDPDDIYVLDNGSTDGSTRSINARVVSRPSLYFNDLDWLKSTVSNFQAQLLQTGYKYVLFAEVDELVVVPTPGGLKAHLAYYRRISASVTGYEVVHDIFSEDDIDRDNLIMKQRRWAVRVPWWDKPLLTSVPLTYCKGFHVCLDGCYAPRDDAMLLFHLDRADFKVCYDRLTAKATQERFDPNEEKDQGVQQHYTGRLAAAYCLNATVGAKFESISGLVAGLDVF